MPSNSFAIKRTGDADYPKHMKVLVQGPPKSGKTTFISTAPNVVVAACEAGLMSIAHLDIPYVNITSISILQNLEMILNDPTLRAAAAKELGVDSIDTVAIDTVDALQEMLKKEILAETRQTQMQQKDWGTLKERLAAMLKRFVALPVNVIFTVHTATTQDDEGKLIYTPGLQGAIKDEIAGYVDFSLLAFRQRETGKDGIARIKYYLKNEGDLKNPSLGNRAAGRLPEVCEPDFNTLHKAVFSAVKPRGRVVEEPSEAEAAKPEPLPAPVAQIVSQSPAPAVKKDTTNTGVPADDGDAPINASGISMLTKSYTEQGFIVPEDLKTWKLREAQQIGKTFLRWKAEMAAGGNRTSRDELIEQLTAYDAFSGEMAGVQTGTDNLKKPKEKKPSPEENPAPDAAKKDSDTPPTEDEARTLLEDQLGAVVIGHNVAPDAACEVCGKPVDDRDIADLGLRKYRKVLCVADFKTAVNEARK